MTRGAASGAGGGVKGAARHARGGSRSAKGGSRRAGEEAGRSGSGRTRSGGPRAAAEAELVFVDDLEIRVIRKRIKNVNLRVKPPDGRIEVSAPFSVSDGFIASFVRDKRRWIDRQRARIASSPQGRASQASPEEVAQWKAVVQVFVPPLVAKWEPVMGVKAGRIAYRNMTSRWGSCQPGTGRICINVRLALYPPECLEYVVVHELCHLLERGHGPRFKELMDAFLPDWRAARAKLR